LAVQRSLPGEFKYKIDRNDLNLAWPFVHKNPRRKPELRKKTSYMQSGHELYRPLDQSSRPVQFIWSWFHPVAKKIQNEKRSDSYLLRNSLAVWKDTALFKMAYVKKLQNPRWLLRNGCDDSVKNGNNNNSSEAAKVT